MPPIIFYKDRTVLSSGAIMFHRRRPSVSVLASDDFTDTNGTTLGSHTASDGGTWAKVTGFPSGAATIDSGRVHSSNDTLQHPYYHSWVPSSPDYEVSADITPLSDNNASYIGVAGRGSGCRTRRRRRPACISTIGKCSSDRVTRK